MNSTTPLPLASATPDAGPGSVWPVALLFGAVSSAALAACAYVGIEASGRAPRIDFGAWIAEHALWGMAAGILVTWILRLGGRFDPLLVEPSSRRAAAARLAVVGVWIGMIALAGLSRAPLERFAVVAGAMFAGLGALAFVARLWLRSLRRIRALPRLDPLRVVALLAVLIIPLHDGLPSTSLAGAWRVMLGP
mgnify:CR=1 FL=1